MPKVQGNQGCFASEVPFFFPQTNHPSVLRLRFVYEAVTAGFQLQIWLWDCKLKCPPQGWGQTGTTHAGGKSAGGHGQPPKGLPVTHQPKGAVDGRNSS